MLEKPIGSDSESAEEIISTIGQWIDEDRVFRLDHYLGKAAVQNLIALRFGNTLLEAVWNRNYIESVHILVAESEGVDGRDAYYARSGALRDMVQSHILQLLCMVAMEPPASLEADRIRDEKVKVLRALRPLDAGHAARDSIRGRYTAGTINGQPAQAYQPPEGSDVETFAGVTAHIDNWRWSGVPFHLVTGKRLPERTTRVVVTLKPVTHWLFERPQRAQAAPNRLGVPAAAAGKHRTGPDEQPAGPEWGARNCIRWNWNCRCRPACTAASPTNACSRMPSTATTRCSCATTKCAQRGPDRQRCRRPEGGQAAAGTVSCWPVGPEQCRRVPAAGRGRAGQRGLGMSAISQPVLVADIGGTNARFALADTSQDAPLLKESIREYAVAEFPSLGDAARHHLEQIGAAASRGVFAVAGRVDGDEARITNHPWVISRSRTAAMLGFDELHLINDFAAQAMAIRCCSPRTSSGRRRRRVPGKPGQPRNYAVIGPGTGLGVGGLIMRHGRCYPLETEGGHVSFPPGTPEEIRIRKSSPSSSAASPTNA